MFLRLSFDLLTLTIRSKRLLLLNLNLLVTLVMTGCGSSDLTANPIIATNTLTTASIARSSEAIDTPASITTSIFNGTAQPTIVTSLTTSPATPLSISDKPKPTNLPTQSNPTSVTNSAVLPSTKVNKPPNRTAFSFKPSTGYAWLEGWNDLLAWGGTDKPLQEGKPVPPAWVVYTYNIKILQEKRIAESRFKAAGMIIQVQVSQRWLAWIDYLATSVGEVQEWYLDVYDLQNSQKKTVAHQSTKLGYKDYQIPDFSLNNDNLAWVDKQLINAEQGLSQIKVLDLNTFQEITSFQAPNPKTLLAAPSLSGSALVWQEMLYAPSSTDTNKLALVSSQIIFSDLNKDKPRRTLSHADEKAWQPRFDGNYVVWKVADSANDSGSVVLLKLASAERQLIVKEPIADWPVVNQYGVSWSNEPGLHGNVSFYNFQTNQVEILDKGEVGKTFVGPNFIGWLWSDTFTNPQHIKTAIKLIRFE